MGYPRAGIRWNDEIGWELRCPDCAETKRSAVYWPLTDEFWDKRVMTRCRACHAVLRRRWERARSDRRIPSRIAYAARYRKDAREVLRMNSRLYYLEHSEDQRAKARIYYREHRDEILAKRRARYQGRAA